MRGGHKFYSPFYNYTIFDKQGPLSYTLDLFEWSSSSVEACGVFLEIESILFSTNINHKGLQRTANEYAAERRIYKDLISKNEK